ncbi:MAG: RagB/SusD family nutrient uptake outer membrane protein [Bacteroides sp.]|nr:RagB/SusD family nutrient uptake outer membrane protein [Bacteroides sp.]
MKNIIFKSLTAVALLGGLSSCNDFLDQTSSSSLDGNNIFSNYDYAEGTISNIYNEFGQQNYRARSIWYGYNTDIEFYNSSDGADGKADLATYNAGAGNDQMNTTTGTDLWGKIYSAIEKANLAIEGLREYADLTDVNMQQLLGEAITLRALHYVDLINMWGDVPARFESLNTTNMYPEREDRDVIYKQIIADLQEAQDLCAWPNEISATETVERINKAFVKGLLARVCMQAAGYAQRSDGTNRLSNDAELSKDVLYPIALQACKDVMDQEGTYVALKSNFADIFNNNGVSGDVISAGSESLFEIGYSNDPCRGRIMYTFGIRHESADDMTSMIQGSQVGPMPSFYFDYSVNDIRRDITCCPFRWKNKVQTLQSLSSWSFGKLRYEWTERFISSGNDDGINKMYMRYADVVLMRAELENELNGPSSAAPYLTKIRNRAFSSSNRATEVTAYVTAASASQDAMFEAIVNERAFEFAGELIRKADLIRWGMLKSKMDESIAKMKALVELQDYDEDHPYSQLSGHLYYYMTDYAWTRNSISYTASAAELNLYGLNYGETTLNPSGYEEYTNSEGAASTWIKSNALDDVINYVYLRDPDVYQYWPIFNVNLNDNPNLSNYDWY